MLEYRITPLPLVWPGKATSPSARRRAPFKTIETRALALLEREVRMLGGSKVEIAVDVEPRHLRQDGMLRADARPRSPAVIVSFQTRDGRLQFPADTFSAWWSNIDAVARALEALRMVDRYGVQAGRQYAGFKALPASASPTQSAADAAEVIARAAGLAATAKDVLEDAATSRRAITRARAATHPDRHGGERAAYDLVDLAAAVLDRHHGRST